MREAGRESSRDGPSGFSMPLFLRLDLAWVSGVVSRLAGVNQGAGGVGVVGQGGKDGPGYEATADYHLQAGRGAHHTQGLFDFGGHAAGNIGGMAGAERCLQRSLKEARRNLSQQNRVLGFGGGRWNRRRLPRLPARSEPAAAAAAICSKISSVLAIVPPRTLSSATSP